METITFWCRATFFLRYAGKLASAWITVIIAAERFITVAYPLRVARISTPTIAKIIIVCVHALCCSLGAYPFWTIGLSSWKNSTICAYTDAHAYEKWSMAILRIGSLFLPSIVIFVLTVLIIVYLRRAKRRRLQKLETHAQLVKYISSKVDLQLTLMLISVSIAFLVLRLPYTVTFYLNAYKYQLWTDPPLDTCTSNRIYLANKICDMIAITNYGVNFFLYCLCGSTFRNRLWMMLSCGSKRRIRFSSSQTTSSRMSLSSFRASMSMRGKKTFS